MYLVRTECCCLLQHGFSIVKTSAAELASGSSQPSFKDPDKEIPRTIEYLTRYGGIGRRCPAAVLEWFP